MDETDVKQEAKLSKGGETPITITMQRTKANGGGLLFSVHTTQQVEDFMNSLGDGTYSDVKVLGRSWTPLDKTVTLSVYTLNRTLPDKEFSLSNAGRDFMKGSGDVDGYGKEINGRVNLSFLRLVGISRGVQFVVHGVYSNDEVTTLRNRIVDGMRALYVNYLKPIHHTVMVVTQEG